MSSVSALAPPLRLSILPAAAPLETRRRTWRVLRDTHLRKTRLCRPLSPSRREPTQDHGQSLRRELHNYNLPC